MSDKKLSDTSAEVSKRPDWALLIDLDTAGVNGVQAYYDAYSAVLSQLEISLTEPLFVRFLLGKQARIGLKSLFAHIKRTRDDVSKIIEALPEAVEKEFLKASPLATTKALASLAREKSARILALSSFEPEIAQKLIALAGLDEDIIIKHYKIEGCATFDNNIWNRAQEFLKLPGSRCIALAGTAISARSAVYARMFTASYLMPLTEHQDFSGVDWLGTGASAKEAKQISAQFWGRFLEHV